MMKRGMSFLLSSAAVVAMTAGFAGVANAGAGGCCDQVEDLQRQIYLLQSQIDELKANPGGLSPKWKAAPKWSEDGMTFKVRGRVMADWGWIDGDTEPGTPDNADSYGQGSEFRRARLGVEGNIQKSTKYKFEVDFADGGTDITDAYLQQKVAGAKITVGQFKTPNSLEEQTSSRYITFIERAAFTDAFGFDRRIGAGVGFGGDNWTLNAGAFSTNGNNNDDTEAGEAEEAEDYAFSARGTFAPISEKTKSIHLGASVRYRGVSEAENGDSYTYDQRPVFHRHSEKAVDTGGLDVESDLFWGLEAAGVYGPFSIQGEYAQQHLSMEDSLAPGADDPTFRGWYVDASVFLTGESRSYKANKGSFGRVKVANPVNEGGLGAWQLAVRYDYLDLEDGEEAAGDPVNGGEYKAYQAAVNWHLNNYTRLMFNYAHIDVEDSLEDTIGGTPVSGDNEYDTFIIRAQIDW